MKKYLFLLTLTALISAYAEQRACEISYNDTLVSQRVHTTKSCGCVGTCLCDYAERPATRTPCYGAYSAPYRVGGCMGFFGAASFIYWEAIEENLSMGLANQASSAFPTQGTLLDLDFSYKPGFQVGVGIDFDHDFWQAFLNYTYFHPHTTGSSSAPKGGTIYPNWIPSDHFHVQQAGAVSGSWDLGVDLIDLQLSRHYYNGVFLTLKPFFGVRAAFISQNYTVSYTPLELILESNRTLQELSKKRAKEKRVKLNKEEEGIKQRLNQEIEDSKLGSINKISSWGIGPSIGCDSYWNFCGGFYLLGNAAASIVYTDYQLTTKWTSPSSQSDSVEPTLKDDISYLRPGADLALGIGWEDYFMVDRWHFDISLAYDMHVLWNQNLFIVFDENSNQASSLGGDLYLHGLTLKLTVHF